MNLKSEFHDENHELFNVLQLCYETMFNNHVVQNINKIYEELFVPFFKLSNHIFNAISFVREKNN